MNLKKIEVPCPRQDPMDTPMSTSEQKGLLLGILADFAQGDPQEVLDYLDHVGFNLLCLSGSQDLGAAWCGFYRIKPGLYDIDRACADLATWPPIAAAITEGIGRASSSHLGQNAHDL